jgi:hypothetical protein
MRPAAKVGRSVPRQKPGVREDFSCDLLNSPALQRGAARAFREMAIADDCEPEDDPRQRLDLLYRDQAPKLRRRLRARLGSSEDAIMPWTCAAAFNQQVWTYAGGHPAEWPFGG